MAEPIAPAPDDPRRRIGGVPLRAFAPNAITALALCFGLTGVRSAVGEEWEKALAAIIFAGVLDGVAGRVARLLRAQRRFGRSEERRVGKGGVSRWNIRGRAF